MTPGSELPSLLAWLAKKLFWSQLFTLGNSITNGLWTNTYSLSDLCSWYWWGSDEVMEPGTGYLYMVHTVRWLYWERAREQGLFLDETEWPLWWLDKAAILSDDWWWLLPVKATLSLLLFKANRSWLPLDKANRFRLLLEEYMDSKLLVPGLDGGREKTMLEWVDGKSKLLMFKASWTRLEPKKECINGYERSFVMMYGDDDAWW